MRNALAALARGRRGRRRAGGAARGARRLPGRQAAAGGARRGRAASPSTTTSRTTRPPSRATLAALRAARGRRAPGGRLRAALVHLPHPRLPGRLRPRVRRRPTGCIVAAAHLPGKVPGGAAALGGRPRGGDRPAGRRRRFLPERGGDRGRARGASCGRATGSRSSRTGASAGSTRSSSRPWPESPGLKARPQAAACPAEGRIRPCSGGTGPHCLWKARSDLCYKSPAFTRLMFPPRQPSSPWATRIQHREEEKMRRELLALAGLGLLLAAPRLLALETSRARPAQAAQAPPADPASAAADRRRRTCAGPRRSRSRAPPRSRRS